MSRSLLEKCPHSPTPCRHCSKEVARTEGTKIVKDGATFKPAGRIVIERELGMFCNNYNQYCDNMKTCPGSGVMCVDGEMVKKSKKCRKKACGTKKKQVVVKEPLKQKKKITPSPKKRVKRKKWEEQQLLEI
jgi:hypothetical protein